VGRFVVLFALAGLTITAPNVAQAKGGTFHLFSAQAAEAATGSHAGISNQSEPSNTFWIGCGRGRYRDAHSFKCVGPADVAR
jgi:hypothetical protein